MTKVLRKSCRPNTQSEPASPLSLLVDAQAVALPVLLTDVTIINVETGALTPGQSLLIRDGTIGEIGESIAQGDATLIDTDGASLIPGLWDSHVHIFSSPSGPDSALPLYQINGVTGIRDMGAG